MRTSALTRLVVMGMLLVGLLIPLQMIQSVVSERASRRESVAEDVGATWGGVQTIGGPLLTVPYRYFGTGTDGRPFSAVAQAFFLPDVLDIKGSLEPQLLKRGLFEVVVYKAHMTMAGRFVRPDFVGIRTEGVEPVWEEATVSVGIADGRGIAKRVVLKWNGGDVPLVPGVESAGLFASGCTAP